jgi:hypothetical protein
MIYFCCDQLRRNAVAASMSNGIDFLEVLDHDTPPGGLPQQTLLVYFINQLGGLSLTPGNILITGGERITNIGVTNVQSDATNPKLLTIQVDQPGDFSTYTLSLVQDANHLQTPAGLDPMLSTVDFSFKAECPSNFDCKPVCACPPATLVQPEINYLARDYQTFRQLMLDRMSALMPQWTERHAADIGVTLVELLAYTADRLSYAQDAIGTEAYFSTARRRVSLRRHARLVDYQISEGCNARVWLQLQVNADIPQTAALRNSVEPAWLQFFTRIPGQPPVLPNQSTVLAQAQEIFESRETVGLFTAHNEIHFYTWSDRRCCLPQGATHATLHGNFPNLQIGHAILFEEVFGPNTGRIEDANPAHRQVVRLTEVQSQDTLGQPLIDPLTGEPVTEISWAMDDALTFALCISSQADAQHGGQPLPNDVSVARGNLVLADHGSLISDEALGVVPSPEIFLPNADNCSRCEPANPTPVWPRYRPSLQSSPLTQAAPYDPTAPAISAINWNLGDVVPEIQLQGNLGGNNSTWLPAPDLLGSEATTSAFVVETESDGVASLRFGDGQLGQRPDAGTVFFADYRTGSGTAGNVGAEAIAHLLTNDPKMTAAVTRVRNPLPATGGLDPESLEDVRQRAPFAFRVQERAVTEADYAEVTTRHPEILRAAAEFRWTGSWRTVFIFVERRRGLLVDDDFKTTIREFVEQFRLAGYDLEIVGPQFASLEISMLVCVNADYFRSDVAAAILQRFSNGILPDGTPGVFYAENFSFGQPVYLSRLYQAAQTVPGVASVTITVFKRQNAPDTDTTALDTGKFVPDRLEIARCDNDPNFPEHGVFNLTMGGGK